MSNILEVLGAKFAAITALKPAPRIEVSESDIVVGELSEAAKKLYVMWMALDREADQAALDLKHLDSDVTPEVEWDAEGTAIRKRVIADICEGLFWVQVKDEFDLWSAEKIGIRKSWQVVRISTSLTDLANAVNGGHHS